MNHNNWFEQEINIFLHDIASTEKVDEIAALFDIILTPREINDISRRLEASKMLSKGASYSEVRTKLGLNPNTIARISNHIGYGFRRSEQKTQKNAVGKIKNSVKKPIRKYKGSIPIHRMFNN